MQTAQKQHVYLCCAEIKPDDWNQWSLLYSSFLVAFSSWLNDSSSRHPWTEWDAEAEEDVGLSGRERQVHRSTPTNMEESWDGIRVQSLSPPTKKRMGLHWDCECKTVEHFIISKSKFDCQTWLYLTKKWEILVHMIINCLLCNDVLLVFNGELGVSGWSYEWLC